MLCDWVAGVISYVTYSRRCTSIKKRFTFEFRNNLTSPSARGMSRQACEALFFAIPFLMVYVHGACSRGIDRNSCLRNTSTLFRRGVLGRPSLHACLPRPTRNIRGMQPFHGLPCYFLIVFSQKITAQVVTPSSHFDRPPYEAPYENREDYPKSLKHHVGRGEDIALSGPYCHAIHQLQCILERWRQTPGPSC